jgi:hypothetical protein
LCELPYNAIDVRISTYSTFLRVSPILCAALWGAQVPRFSLEDLVDGSQYIVHGRVIRTFMGWDARHRYIWTHHEIEVADVLRGTPGSRVTVSEPGGSLDGVHQAFSGTLPFAPGEEVVVFLYRTPAGFLRAAGGVQGKFTVDRAGRARAQLAGTEVVDNPVARRGISLAAIDALDVREFKRRVREVSLRHPARGLPE